jgi:hypothetical protein
VLYMLEAVSDESCYVLPAGSDIGISWADLQTAFASPYESGLIDENFIAFMQRNGEYPRPMPNYSMLAGPDEGGIFVVDEAGIQQPTVLSSILTAFASWDIPLGMGSKLAPNGPRVIVFEVLPFLRGGKPRQKLVCPVRTEHSESAGERVFWVVEHAGEKFQKLHGVNSEIKRNSTRGLTHLRPRETWEGSHGPLGPSNGNEQSDCPAVPAHLTGPMVWSIPNSADVVSRHASHGFLTAGLSGRRIHRQAG